MFLSDLSIKRPVFATVMMLALVVLGMFSFKRLSVDMFPDVEIPVVSIVTLWPGASPETVEREVSKPIEEAVNPIEGVKHIYSYSMESVSYVVVEFELEVKINDASQEARAKINAIRGSLPQEIEEPIIQKIDFGSMPVISLAVQSERLSPRELTRIADKQIKPRLENLRGVGKVELVGQAERAVNVNLDPRRLEALGMGVDEVAGGLSAENLDVPLGRLLQNGTESAMRIVGKPATVEALRRMVISQRAGRPVTLGELAEIEDGIEEARSLALVDGVPAIAINVTQQSGANTVEVVDGVIAEVAKLEHELPAEATLSVVRDSSVMIRESVADVLETLVIGAILTVLIVFLFLNSWRSTVITGLTLPVSVISAFIAMYFLGMTMNMLTLMALSLAIGLLIDDAIVVRENIVRHLERGKNHMDAARDGTNEIGLAVLATTFSIVAVFVPVAFMKGIVGRFFYQFGLTVAFAVLVSLFVSFTLDPMLSSRWTDPAVERTGRKRPLLNRILDRFNDRFDRAADRYRGVIAWALDHRKTVFAVTVLAFVSGVVAFQSLGSEFMTSSDYGQFDLNFETAPDASLAESENRLRAMLAELSQIPEIAHTFATIGAGDTGTVRQGKIYVKLVDKGEREPTQFDVERLVRQRMERVPGIRTSITETGRMGGEKALQINFQGEDLQLLKRYGAELKDALYRVPGIVDLEVSLELETPEYQLRVDRERARDAGISTANVVSMLSLLVGGRAVTTYEDEEGEAIDVRLRLPEALRQDIAQVAALRVAVRTATGETALVPISDIAQYTLDTTPSQIIRQDLARQVQVSANLDGIPLGDAINIAREAGATMQLAPGYQMVFSGQAENMAESFGYMKEALLLAVLFVYLILAAQFESFIDPLAIMLSLPLSLIGMAGALLLTGDRVSILSLIGLIMLMGLVTKNAILLVDYAKILQKRGMDRREALIEAGRTRLRPIVMTTLAMIFGMLPLALALGSGGEFRAPMGRAVIGGLITSTLLTLIVVPVIYTLLNDFGNWLHRWWIGKGNEEVHI